MSRCRSVVSAGVLLLVALAVAGCGSTDGAAGLDGTAWVLQGWSVSSIDPTGFEITATFSDGQMGGRAAVNSYGAPYTADSGGRFATGEVSRTLMAGSELAMRAEDAYFELLGQARKYSLEGSTLKLLDANSNELLIFVSES